MKIYKIKIIQLNFVGLFCACYMPLLSRFIFRWYIDGNY
ncbi:putative membrane protein [Citrobacter freundii]|nr:putative membrane protein [Citrobacter freundii]